RAGGGFDDKSLKEVWQELKPLVVSKPVFKQIPAEIRKSTWVRPKLVCEVRFNEWTSAHQLRAPIFQGLRDDIDAEDCTLEDSIPAQAAPPKAPSLKVRKASTPEFVTRVEL